MSGRPRRRPRAQGERDRLTRRPGTAPAALIERIWNTGIATSAIAKTFRNPVRVRESFSRRRDQDARRSPGRYTPGPRPRDDRCPEICVVNPEFAEEACEEFAGVHHLADGEEEHDRPARRPGRPSGVPQQQPEQEPDHGDPEDRKHKERTELGDADLAGILGEQGQDRVDGEQERMDRPRPRPTRSILPTAHQVERPPHSVTGSACMIEKCLLKHRSNVSRLYSWWTPSRRAARDAPADRSRGRTRSGARGRASGRTPPGCPGVGCP